MSEITPQDGESSAQERPPRAQPVVSVVSTSTSTALRVDYDGRHPPLELFFVWGSLGWRTPVPASPPREAIDWSTPDPVKGTRHTILPFTATGTATIETNTPDIDRLVTDALDAAARLGCRVERPEPPVEIDLREPESEPPSPAPRPRRRARGPARARVRGIVPALQVGTAREAGRGIGAEVHDETTGSPDGARRVTFEVKASEADTAMRLLHRFATGTPTIEVVAARDLAEPRA